MKQPFLPHATNSEGQCQLLGEASPGNVIQICGPRAYRVSLWQHRMYIRVFFRMYFLVAEIIQRSVWVGILSFESVKVAQSCPILCNPRDYTVLGILQARMLEWAAFPFSRGSSQPRDQTQVFRIAGGFFTS